MQSFRILNPLSYPLAVAAGGLILFFGVRIAALPTVLVAPIAAGFTIAAATVRQHQEPTPEKEILRQVQAELQGVRTAADRLRQQAADLLRQANQVLRQEELSHLSMDILAAVQYGCDLAIALPEKVDRLAAKLPQTRSLLDTDSLEQQLQQVQRDKLNATGSAYSSLQRLEESLQRNLSLLNTNQDDRKAQILNLAALIQDSGGVLQRLQNHLQTANLADVNQLDQLQDLIGEMNRLQQEADLFV